MWASDNHQVGDHRLAEGIGGGHSERQNHWGTTFQESRTGSGAQNGSRNSEETGFWVVGTRTICGSSDKSAHRFQARGHILEETWGKGSGGCVAPGRGQSIFCSSLTRHLADAGPAEIWLRRRLGI